MLQNHPATKASRPNKPSKANGHQQKQLTARSILSPFDPVKVSKALSKRQSPHQKMSVPCNASQEVEKTATDSSSPDLRSKQALKVRNLMPASLPPIHSSRVSKAGGKRPTRLRRDGTKLPPTTGKQRLTREDNLGTLSAPSTGRKAMQQSANTSLRRSTQISKQPKRFCPGYM